MVNHLRLGLYRRNKRNYSYHLRKFGKSCFERMDEKRLLNFRKMMLYILVITADEPKEVDLFNLSVILYHNSATRLREINTPNLGFVDVISRGIITLVSFTANQIHRMTGFSAINIKDRLMIRLGIPEYFVLGRGLKLQSFVKFLSLNTFFDDRTTHISRRWRTCISLFPHKISLAKCTAS